MEFNIGDNVCHIRSVYLLNEDTALNRRIIVTKWGQDGTYFRFLRCFGKPQMLSSRSWQTSQTHDCMGKTSTLLSEELKHLNVKRYVILNSDDVLESVLSE